MTARPMWPRVLAKAGSLGRIIEFRASIALQLRRRRQLDELSIFDATRIGYPHRYSGMPPSFPVTLNWWEALAEHADSGRHRYVMIRNEQLRWLTSQLGAETCEPESQ